MKLAKLLGKWVLFALVVLCMFGTMVEAASASEDVTVSFTSNSAAETRNLYTGVVTLTVEGVGQSSWLAFNDAFYIYTDYNGTSVQPYILSPFLLGINERAVTDYISAPSYNNNHQYTFSIDVGQTPAPIRFSVLDGYRVDNSGNFRIRVNGQSTTRATCSDSDNGRNIETAGTVSGVDQNGNSYSYADKCHRDDRVDEYMCENGQWKVEEGIYCEHACDLARNRCLRPVSCTDSDSSAGGGVSAANVRGTVTGRDQFGATYSLTDFCGGDTQKHIIEYMCDGSIVKIERPSCEDLYGAGSYCSSGQCVGGNGQRIDLKADLVVTGIDMTPANPSAGQSVHFEANTKNYGNKASGVVNIKWFMDGQQIGYGSYGPHRPDATFADYSDNIRFDWTATPGTHTLSYVIDSDNMEVESNENNNKLSKTFVVNGEWIDQPTPIEQQGIDLSIKKAGVYESNGLVTFFVNADAVGSQTQGTLPAQMAVNVNGNRQLKDVQVFYGTTENSWEIKVPAREFGITDFGKTTYYITITVDSNFKVAETNENNNAYSLVVDKYSIVSEGNGNQFVEPQPVLVNPPTFPTEDEPTHSVQLASGWNLISLPSPLVKFVSGERTEENKRLLGFVYLADQKKYVTLQEAQEKLGDGFGKYLVTHAFWVYSYSPSNLYMKLDQRQIALEGYNLEKGWNLAPVLSSMVGKTLAEASANQCTVKRAYYWNAGTQSWDKINGNTFSSNQVNTGFIVNVQESCSFNAPKIMLTPPAMPEDDEQRVINTNDQQIVSTTTRMCTKDVKVCPDGSTVSRNPKDNCEFFACKIQIKDSNQTLAENSAALNVKSNVTRLVR